MNINLKKLASFLEEANQNTYANKDAKRSDSLRPESQDYHFKKEGLTYHDTYFGAKNFIGEEIVYENGKPVWGMNYYGFLTGDDAKHKEVYIFLRKALMQKYNDIIPVRGPKEFSDDNLKYVNSAEGGLEKFTGKEKILADEKSIYECFYHGGFIE